MGNSDKTKTIEALPAQREFDSRLRQNRQRHRQTRRRLSSQLPIRGTALLDQGRSEYEGDKRVVVAQIGPVVNRSSSIVSRKRGKTQAGQAGRDYPGGGQLGTGPTFDKILLKRICPYIVYRF